MTYNEPPPTAQPGGPSPLGVSPGLIERVKGMILSPAREWERVDAEPATIQSLFVGYVCILAAIPAVCTLIGMSVFGFSMGPISYRPSIMTTLSSAVVAYVLALVSVGVMALIIEFLAPSFCGTKDRLQAFKVAAYFPTAAWVAGVFNLLPAIGWIGGLLGLYSLYVLYLGLPRLMRVPQEKAIVYTVVVVIAAIVLFMIIGAITGGLTSMGTRIGNPAAPAVAVYR